MAVTDDGIRSEALRAALVVALSGKPDRLEDLLCRHGGGPDPRPNLRLAAALGVELAALPGPVTSLLSRFAADVAAPDGPRVFLPMAAAHGWVALLRAGRDVEQAWAALGGLAADERAPVRVATLDALAAFVLREGGALDLARNALGWLSMDSREERFSAAALAIEVLGDKRAVAALADHAERLDYLSAALDEIAAAPRSAERLESRRRLMTALPQAIAAVVAKSGAADRGALWMESLCRETDHPDVRKVLSDSILRLRATSLGPGSAVSQRLRQVLEKSAKPLRDPSRLRPGTGRGKASRPMR